MSAAAILAVTPIHRRSFSPSVEALNRRGDIPTANANISATGVGINPNAIRCHTVTSCR
jgi:hypothetical protein